MTKDISPFTEGHEGRIIRKKGIYDIKSSYGKQVGGNLYHSFTKFDVETGKIALFSGPSSISNIFGRVTGGSVSMIDGRLQSAIDGADLFFLNPAGIIFGPNASLDIAGSIHISTADYIRLNDGSRFVATATSSGLLTSVPPAAFGFLDKSSSSIEISNQARLSASASQSISIVGGDIMFNAGKTYQHHDIPAETLSAPGGRIELISIASSGEVELADDGLNFSSLDILGNIDILGKSHITVDGAPAGDIYVRAGKFYMDNSKMTSVASGGSEAGIIDINARDIHLLNGSTISGNASSGEGCAVSIKATGSVFVKSNSAISTLSYHPKGSFQSKNAGDVTISASNFICQDGGTIETVSVKGGKGGDIRIAAENDVQLLGHNSILNSSVFNGTSDAGNILVTAKNIIFENGGGVSSHTDFTGNGGNVRIEAEETIALRSVGKGYASTISTSTLGDMENAGAAGDIVIEARELLFENGGGIDANTGGAGDAGNIRIHVSDRIKLDGINANPNDGQPSAITSQSETSAEGNAGDIFITSGTLSVQNGALISNSVDGTGNGGTIIIEASETVLLSGFEVDAPELNGKPFQMSSKESLTSQVSTSTNGQGRAGDIRIQAPKIEVQNNAHVASESTSNSRGGDAGSIFMTADGSIIINNRGKITTEAVSSGGGDISIKTQDLLHIKKGDITTSVMSGQGSGGNINLRSDHLVMDQSRIVANAYEGKGGNIQITSGQLIRTPDSAVSASSRLGIDGSVQIRSPETDVGGLLQAMPAKYLNVENWQRTPCAERRGEYAGRFVMAPRDAIPTPFDDWLGVPPLAFNDINAINGIVIVDQHAIACYRKGRFDCALKEWEKSFFDSSRNIERSLLTSIFIADTLQRQGFLKRALDTLQQAMGLIEKSDTDRKAAAMNALSDIHLCLENFDKARSSMAKARAAARESGNPLIHAALWNNDGNLAAVEGDDLGALKAYEKSLQWISQSDQNSDGMLLLKSTVRINLSRLLLQMEDHELFKVALRSALEETIKLPDVFLKTTNLTAIGLLSEEASKTVAHDKKYFSDLSKQSFVHAYRLAKASDLPVIQAKILGELGEHLRKERRLKEAGSYIRKAISLAQKRHCPEVSYDLYRIGAKILDASRDMKSASEYYNMALSILHPIRSEFFKGYRKESPVFNQIVDPVYADYAELLFRMAEKENDPDQREKHLAEARTILDRQRIAELENHYKDECLGSDYKIMDSRPYLSDDRAAVIYPVPLKEKIILLVVFADSIKTMEIGIDARSIGVHIQRLRRLLEEELPRSKRDLRSLFYAKKLYRSLIRPMEAELDRRQIDTIVFCPNGQFRLIPFAVLHDGDRYLIEQYAVAVIPSLPAVDTVLYDRSALQPLIVGLSESRHGFPPLKNVVEEMKTVRKKMGGHILSDKYFTRKNLMEALKRTPYTIIHMATHGHFGRTPEDTYLLAYDGKISLSDLNRFVGIGRFRDEPIELLTLSACQSALGDERAALGLAGVSLKAGAESAMATLWRVDDEAASDMIGAFYAQLKKPGASKAVALQQAQIEMLNSKRFNHPAFWSPFVIIGKWL